MALQTLRTHSKGWVAGILFFLLILAFAAWGIEDMLRQGFSRSTPVMTIGDESISQREFESAYQNMVRNVQERFQRQIDYDTAKSMGLVDALIAELQSDRMFAQEAQAKGILISDLVARENIRADSRFRGADNKFDYQTFIRAIQNAGFSEGTFVQLIKSNLARAFLVGSIGQFEGAPPKALADQLYNYRDEYRTAEVLTVPTAPMKPPAPTDAQLAAYHKEHAAKYTAPEYRTIMLVLVEPKDAAARVPVTDAELKAEYAARKPEFTTPETRKLRQIILKDEAAAKKAYEALVGGRTFEAVAEDIAKTKPIDLGRVKASDLPVQALSDAAFKVKKGEVTHPIKTPLGWHIIKVDDVTPQYVKPFDDVKAQIEKDYRARHATKILAELHDRFDDALGSGMKLEEAANKLGFTIRKIGPIDARGKDEKGQAVQGLPNEDKFLANVFQKTQGDEGELVDLRDQGFYSVRVDSITPSHLKPLDAVKKEVTGDWSEAQQAKMAKSEADKLAAEAKSGKTLEEIGKATQYAVSKSKPVRRGDGAAAPGSMEAQIFAVKPGDVTVAQVREGYAVLKISTAKDERSAADRKKDREDFDQKLQKSFGQDILASYTDYLRAHYPTKIERGVIDQLLGGKGTQ
jgi:peptidyl-prolyl cis-trans isomerase D